MITDTDIETNYRADGSVEISCGRAVVVLRRDSTFWVKGKLAIGHMSHLLAALGAAYRIAEVDQ